MFILMFVKCSVEFSYKRNRLKLKLLLQSVKVKASLLWSCHDTSKLYINCIYLSLNASRYLEAELLD